MVFCQFWLFPCPIQSLSQALVGLLLQEVRGTMIKRQFYTLEHASHAAQASSSSSSSSSASHLSAASQSDADSVDAQPQDEATSPVAIHQNRESSVEEEPAQESDDDSSVKRGWDAEEDGSEDSLQQSHKRKGSRSRAKLSNQWADAVAETMKERAHDFEEECVVMCKNVLKCRLCPQTLCLSADTMRAHLSSKKHARSLKHLEEGKLKIMLNSDGEEEEQGETHAERYARRLASAKQEINPTTLKRKRDSGRQRASRNEQNARLDVTEWRSLMWNRSLQHLGVNDIQLARVRVKRAFRYLSTANRVSKLFLCFLSFVFAIRICRTVLMRKDCSPFGGLKELKL